MNTIQSRSQRLNCLLIFLVFLGYFATTAYFLPSGAGPDYPLSRLSADFYLQNGRLATYPEDEKSMAFSNFGNSRLLRPPLGFASAAAISKLRGTTIEQNTERYYSYRLANAFYGALTVAIIYAALYLLLGNALTALFGSILIGLMPQFTFIASYLNDDGAAIAAVSILVLTMLKIVKSGASFSNCILFAFAVGLTIITKKAGWVFLPAAVLFYLGFILRFNREFLSKHIAMFITFIFAGGWWLIFNMMQYGWDDPILSKVIHEAAWKNTKFDLNKFGFLAEKGVGVSGLVFGNYAHFWQATYKAVVGHLDWLAIRVGSLQYNYYLIFLIGAIANTLLLLQKMLSSRFTDKMAWFEVILYIGILLQISAFVWVNVANDIQIQGKYIMPVILPILLLSLSFYTKLFSLFSKNKQHLTRSNTSNTKLVLMILLIISPVLVHIDAIVDHVVPFYWPDASNGLLNALQNYL